MFGDFGELENALRWGKEAHGAAVPSSVRETWTEFGVYVAVESMVLALPKLALSASDAKEANLDWLAYAYSFLL
jgi:hypothetical protein